MAVSRRCCSFPCVAVFAVHLLLLAISVLYIYSHSIQLQHDKSAAIMSALSKASAHVLSIDLILITFSVCCDLAQLLRTALASPLEWLSSILYFPRLLYWGLLPLSVLHVGISWVNLGIASSTAAFSFTAYVYANVGTVSGFAGHVLILLVLFLVLSLKVAPGSKNLPVPALVMALFYFAWLFHVSFSQSEELRYVEIPLLTWLCIFFAILIYNVQVLYRQGKLAARQAMTVSKIIEHPGRVMELRISKGAFHPKLGQSIQICFPNDRLTEYHPFPLISAPEEEHLSVLLHCEEDDNERMALSLSNRIVGLSARSAGSADVLIDMDSGDKPDSFASSLPQVFLSGPYGFASDSIFRTEVALLITTNQNVIKTASVLKSIWFRATSLQHDSLLRKVYFYWICETPDGFEWFRSLLLAIEAQDFYNFIEIHVCVPQTYSKTGSIECLDEIARAEPDWNLVIAAILKLYPNVDVFDMTCGMQESLEHKVKSSDRAEIVWHQGLN